MITIREYLDLRGRNVWEDWFECLNAPAADKVTTAQVSNEQGEHRKSRLESPVDTGASDIE